MGIVNSLAVRADFDKYAYQAYDAGIMPIAVVVAALLSFFVAVGVRNFPHANVNVSPKPTSMVISPTIMDTTSENETGTPTLNLSPTPKATNIHTVSPTATAKPTTPTPTATQFSTATPKPSTTDTSAPTFDYMTGPADGSTVSFNSFCFPMKFSDATSPILVRYAMDTTAPTDWNQNYAPCYSSVSNGSHTFMVQAKDGAGNMTGYIRRSFIVDIANPTNQITQSPTPTMTVTVTP